MTFWFKKLRIFRNSRQCGPFADKGEGVNFVWTFFIVGPLQDNLQVCQKSVFHTPSQDITNKLILVVILISDKFT